ncbi:MAG: glycosyltransferase [Bacilli bacterium]|jgi:glycosyltransferase involved in cell wall biosynthesis|nr:glycosyltransferase [Bacilli bacterium]
MKWFLNSILILFLIFLFFCFSQLWMMESYFCFGLIFIVASLFILIGNIFYHNHFKFVHFRKRHVLGILILFGILSLGMFYDFSFSIQMDYVLYGGYIFSSFLLFLFLIKEYDVKMGICGLFFSLLFQLFFVNIYNYELMFFQLISNGMLYVTTWFDEIAIYRKKNFIYMLFLGILLGGLTQVFPVVFFYGFFLLGIIARKRGIKSAVKLSTASIVGFVGGILFPLEYLGLSIQLPWITFSNWALVPFVFFLLLFMGGTIWCFYHPERKIGYFWRLLFLLSFLGLYVFSFPSLIYYFAFFQVVFLLLALQILDNSLPFFVRVVKIHKGHKAQSIHKERISVVIPNYNYANYLEDRIDSILFQTYCVSEIIILDDASVDSSEKVILQKIEEMKEKYPHIKVVYLPNKKNSGNLFRQWAKCFEVATGDFLWICEADDSAHPKFLETVMPSFLDDDVIMSYAESLTMDENDKLLMANLREWIDIFDTGKWNRSYVNTGVEELYSTLCINNTIPNVSGVVFRLQKDIPYQQYLKGAQDFKLSGDWYFYAKVLEHGSIAYHKKAYNYHRMHQNSVTLTTKDDLHYREICRIQDMIIRDREIRVEVKNRILAYRRILQARFHFGREELRLMNVSFDDIFKKAKIKDEVLLSVIIPVYNTEAYLRKCLDSVLGTIPPKTEIIIVNDGSPDQSAKIIEEYENKFPSIVFGYQKKNGGLSSAKNYGLEKAKGRYVIFLDSDDYVSSNMYPTMLKRALEADADMVYCDIYEVFEDGTKMFFSMCNLEREDLFMQLIDTSLMAASWNKMTKRTLFEDLKYPEGMNNEDVTVSPILFERAKVICHIDSPFYFYLQRSGSIQNSGFNEKRFVIFDAAQLCFERLKKLKSKHTEEVKGSVYTHQILGLLLFVIKNEPRRVRRKYLQMFCERMNEFDDYDTNPYVLEYVTLYHLPKLLSYIKNNEITKLDLYLQLKMQ